MLVGIVVVEGDAGDSEDDGVPAHCAGSGDLEWSVVFGQRLDDRIAEIVAHR